MMQAANSYRGFESGALRQRGSELPSGGACVANDADFTGLSAHNTTTMRRTIRHQIRPARALSGRFLRAMIVEWFSLAKLDEWRTAVATA